jgi:hypothetical protein
VSEYDFYTNCGTCREAVLRHAQSSDAPVRGLSGLNCHGSPSLDNQYLNQHSFMVETLSGDRSSCDLVPEYFSFQDCRAR